MATTIGDMIDQLTIANIRLWHIEDERREHVKKAKSSILSFNNDETYNSLDKIANQRIEQRSSELLEMIAKVNKERNALIDQINASVGVLIDKARNKDSTFELTAESLLGTGKNKFYKTEDV